MSTDTHSLKPQAWADTAVPDVAGAEWSEYRPVSAMFVDLESSVELMGSLGTESYNAALRAFHNLVTLHVRLLNGEVVQYLGDGVMCLFRRGRGGMNRATAAVTAAAQIIEAMKKPSAPFPTNVRIGIASGRALFTDGDKVAGVPVVGPCINLAARLQGVARPGTILVCDESKHNAATECGFVELPEQVLKGFPGKTAFWQVDTPHVRHLQSANPAEPSSSLPLVGREAELAVLEHALSETIAGRGLSVIVAGEAGLGKTRLIQEFLQRPLAEDCARIVLGCSRDDAGRDYHPFRSYLHWIVGVTPGDDDARRASKLRQMFRAVWGLDETGIEDLLLLLSAHPDKDAKLSGDPVVLRRWLCAQLTDHLIAVRGARPALVAVIEDVHWLDPSSAEFLTGLRASLATHRILLVGSQRSAGPLDDPVLPADHVLRLSPLSQHQSEEMIHRVLGPGPAAGDMVAWVRDRAQGVPLFVSAFADFASRRGGPDFGGSDLPLDLLDVFEQSLGLMPVSTRRFAQVAAVMGPVFEPELIAALLGQTREEMAKHVTLLAQEKLAGERSNGSGFGFSHDLVREAIYGNLSNQLRRRLHGNLADMLRLEWPEAPSHLLALHYERAGRPKDAIAQLIASSLSSVRVGALQEARDYLGRAFGLIDQLEFDHDRHHQELALRSMEGPLHMILGGPGNKTFGDAQRRSMNLMRELGVTQDRAHVFYNSGLHDWACGRLDAAEAMSRTLLELPNEGDGATLAGHTLAGLVAWHKGDIVTAQHHLGQTLTLYSVEEHASLFPKYLKDFGVFSLFYAALAASVGGDFAVARDYAARAQALSETLGIPHAKGFGLLAQFLTALLRDDPPATTHYARLGETLARTHRFPEFQALSIFAQGWAETRREGHHTAGLQRMIDGMEGWKGTNFVAWLSFLEAAVVEELVAAGDLARARHHAGLLKERLARTGENQFLAPALIAEARLLAADGQTSAARQCLTQAVDHARRTQARLWQDKAEQVLSRIGRPLS